VTPLLLSLLLSARAVPPVGGDLPAVPQLAVPAVRASLPGEQLAAPPVAGGGPAFPGAEEGSGRLYAVGDPVGPARVDEIEIHSEFERYHLSLALPRAGQTLPPLEVVPDRAGREGICTHGGWTVFPRWELVGPVPEDPWHEGERPPASVEEQVHAAFCARLAAAPPVAAPAPLPERPAVPPERVVQAPAAPDPAAGDAARVLTPLPLLLAFLGLAMAARGLRGLAPAERRELAGIGVLSLGLRLLQWPGAPFNGALAGYEKLAMAMGQAQVPALYGQGLSALMAPIVRLLGAHPAVVFGTDLALSAVAPLALWATLRPVGGRHTARLGGLFMAVLPLALRLSATEVMTVPLTTLALVAAAGAVASVEAGEGALVAGAMAGLAAGLMVHVRPEGLLVLPALVALPLARRGRAAFRHGGPWLGLVLGGVLVVLRLRDMPGLDPGGPLQPHLLGSPMALLGLVLPRVSDRGGLEHLALDLRWTSPLLWVGPVLALGRGTRRAALPWAAWLLLTLVLVAKSWPLADAMRLQLLAMPAWIALTALAFGPRLAGLAPRRAAALALLGTALVALPASTGWLFLARHAEWSWLRDTVPTLPAGSVVRYDDGPHRASSMAQVLAGLAPGLRWVPASTAPLQDGQLFLRGTTCLSRPSLPEASSDSVCARVEAACRLLPLDGLPGATARLPARTDLDEVLLPEEVHDGQVTVGFYRLADCRRPAPAAGPALSGPSDRSSAP